MSDDMEHSNNRKPLVGCGAAIFNDAGEIFLVRRIRNPEAEHWGLPGGKVDWLETVEDAIRREISEELAVTIKLEKLACIVNHIDEINNEHWVAPVYWAIILSGKPKIAEEHALSDLGWFSLEDLPHPLTRATVQTLNSLGPDRSAIG